MEVCSARIAWSRRCGWDVLTSRSSRLKETTLATRCGLALWPVSGWKKSIPSLCSAKAWDQLSPQERPDCAIFAQNYGQAGAIDFLGRRYGLPPALSGHQTYFLWGPRKYSGKCMIVFDDRKERLDQMFERVEFVGTSADNPDALERNVPVFICKGAKFASLEKIWPQLKRWR